MARCWAHKTRRPANTNQRRRKSPQNVLQPDIFVVMVRRVLHRLLRSKDGNRLIDRLEPSEDVRTLPFPAARGRGLGIDACPSSVSWSPHRRRSRMFCSAPCPHVPLQFPNFQPLSLLAVRAVCAGFAWFKFVFGVVYMAFGFLCLVVFFRARNVFEIRARCEGILASLDGHARPLVLLQKAAFAALVHRPEPAATRPFLAKLSGIFCAPKLALSPAPAPSRKTAALTAVNAPDRQDMKYSVLSTAPEVAICFRHGDGMARGTPSSTCDRRREI